MKYRITVFKFACTYHAYHDHFDPADPIRPSYRLPGGCDVLIIEEEAWNKENGEAIDALVKARAISKATKLRILPLHGIDDLC